MFQQTVIIITGPTASGKTALAVEVAKYFKTSVISADSRQCFRELNIGVAKPDALQLKEVRHFFINSHSIHDLVNAAEFERLSDSWCEQIFQDTDVVVVCGGTGLYIKAFREGLDEIPLIKAEVREQIRTGYAQFGMDWLQHQIEHADPLFFASGEMTNPQRMQRALEVIQSTGRSIQSFQNQEKKSKSYRFLEFAIRVPRAELYSRIEHRVDQMMLTGLYDEVVSLLPFQHLNALQTVGYSELFEHLQGKISLEKAIALIKQNTRHYAKRQITWLNKIEDVIWLEKNYLQGIIDKAVSSKT